MAEAKKINPIVKVKHVKGSSNKCPVASEIEVHLDGALVATATLGGEYTAPAVLKALKNKSDQKRFTVKDADKFFILCNL